MAIEPFVRAMPVGSTVATTPKPSEPRQRVDPTTIGRWWNKPCPQCTALNRKPQPFELFKALPTANIVVCDCGCVYANKIKARE